MSFEVQPKKLNGVASNMRDVQRTVSRLAGSVESCRTKLAECVSTSASPAISRALVSVHGRLERSAENILIMGNHLDAIAKTYEKVEKGIVEKRLTAEEIEAAKSYNADGSVTLESKFELLWGKAAVKVTDAASRVVDNVKSVWGKIKESYDSRGAIYYAVEYGKIVVKAIMAASKIAGALTMISATGGLAAIPVIFSLVSGINDVMSCVADVANLTAGNDEQIGEFNLLKRGFEILGEKIGGETGRKLGEYTYYGLDLLSSIFTCYDAASKVKNLEKVDAAAVAKEGKQAVTAAVKSKPTASILTATADDVRYQKKLVEYAFPEITKLFKDGGIVHKVFDSGKGVIEKGMKMVNHGEKVELFGGYNEVNDTYGKVKNTCNVVGILSDMCNGVVY